MGGSSPESCWHFHPSGSFSEELPWNPLSVPTWSSTVTIGDAVCQSIVDVSGAPVASTWSPSASNPKTVPDGTISAPTGDGMTPATSICTAPRNASSAPSSFRFRRCPRPDMVTPCRRLTVTGSPPGDSPAAADCGTRTRARGPSHHRTVESHRGSRVRNRTSGVEHLPDLPDRCQMRRSTPATCETCHGSCPSGGGSTTRSGQGGNARISGASRRRTSCGCRSSKPASRRRRGGRHRPPLR